MSWFSELWDDVTGKSQTRDAIDAQTALNSQNLSAQNAALAKQDEWTKASMKLQEDMFNRSLAENQGNQAAQMRLAGLGMAGDIAGQQMGLDNAIQMMVMNQADGRTTNMARQSAMQQAMPALMALMGLQPQSVGNGYTESDPRSLQRNLLSELGAANSAVQPMLNGAVSGQQATATNQPTSMAAMGGGAASNTTPWTNANVDVNKLLMMSPTAQFQMKQAEDAVKRSMAARGGLNSSEFSAQMGNIGGQMATQQADKAKNDLWNLVNFGQGGQPVLQGAQAPQVNLSGVGQDMSSALNNAANNRSNLFSSYGQNMGNAMSGYGNTLSSNMSNMGQMNYNQGLNLANLGMQGKSQGGLMGGLSGLTNLASGIGSLGNSWNQLSGLFGGGNKTSTSTGDLFGSIIGGTGANSPLVKAGKFALGLFG